MHQWISCTNLLALRGQISTCHLLDISVTSMFYFPPNKSFQKHDYQKCRLIAIFIYFGDFLAQVNNGKQALLALCCTKWLFAIVRSVKKWFHTISYEPRMCFTNNRINYLLFFLLNHCLIVDTIMPCRICRIRNVAVNK